MKFDKAAISDKIHPDLITMLQSAPPTMGDALGMELVKLDPDEVVGTMPVDHRTVQPVGLLHGGASVALAETLCSIGAWLQLDPNTQTAVGVEINANHIRAVRSGIVVGRAKPIHVGRQLQVWECRIETEDGKLVCTSRCTLMAVARR
jgi:1,4-dihydroxy-2-naphthoyl-CoA hydrolase